MQSSTLLLSLCLGISALLANVFFVPYLMEQLEAANDEASTIMQEQAERIKHVWQTITVMRERLPRDDARIIKRQLMNERCPDGREPAKSGSSLIRCAKEQCPKGYYCTFAEIPFQRLCCQPQVADSDQCSCNPDNKCPAGPKGPPGTKGPNGVDGFDGEDGLPGEDAADFEYRLQPSDCSPCPPGPPGKEGPPGPKGGPGGKGEEGLPGKSIPNEKGPPGPKGRSGPQGKQGPRGPKGPPGKDGTSGKSGKPGPQGPKGKDGRRGAPGEKGQKGEDGPAGQAGSPGKDGKPGQAGPGGKPGKQGPAGVPGNDAQYCPCPRRTPRLLFPQYRKNKT